MAFQVLTKYLLGTSNKPHLKHFRELEVECVDPSLNVRKHLGRLRVAVMVEKRSIGYPTVLHALPFFVRLRLNRLNKRKTFIVEPKNCVGNSREYIAFWSIDGRECIGIRNSQLLSLEQKTVLFRTGKH